MSMSKVCAACEELPSAVKANVYTWVQLVLGPAVNKPESVIVVWENTNEVNAKKENKIEFRVIILFILIWLMVNSQIYKKITTNVINSKKP